MKVLLAVIGLVFLVIIVVIFVPVFIESGAAIDDNAESSHFFGITYWAQLWPLLLIAIPVVIFGCLWWFNQKNRPHW